MKMKMKIFSCSSMARTKQTANTIYNEIDAMYDKHNESNGLKGRNIRMEGKKWESMQRDEPDPLLMEGRP